MQGGFLPEPSEALPPRFASASSWQQAAAQRGTQPAPPQQQARVQRPAAAAAVTWGDGEPPDLELEAQGGCSRCPSLTFRSDWLKAFGVVLCNSCAKAERLISKVRAAAAGRCFSAAPALDCTHAPAAPTVLADLVCMFPVLPLLLTRRARPSRRTV